MGGEPVDACSKTTLRKYTSFKTQCRIHNSRERLA